MLDVHTKVHKHPSNGSEIIRWDIHMDGNSMIIRVSSLLPQLYCLCDKLISTNVNARYAECQNQG
jgi:hypothetical protein